MGGSEAAVQRVPRVSVSCTTQICKHCDNLCEPVLDFRSPGTLFRKSKTPWFIPGGAWHVTASELTAGLQLAPAGIIDFIHSCMCSPKEAHEDGLQFCVVLFHFIYSQAWVPVPCSNYMEDCPWFWWCAPETLVSNGCSINTEKNNWLLTCGCKIHHHALNTLCIPSLG